MKKTYHLLILLVSLLNIQYSNSACIELNPSKASNCHDKTVANSGTYCCYYKIKSHGVSAASCLELPKEQKDKIDDYIKNIETSGISVESLDCKSSFIEFGLFSLIFLLL